MVNFFRRIGDEIERVGRRVNGEIVRVTDRIVEEITHRNAHEDFLARVAQYKLNLERRISYIPNNQEEQEEENDDVYEHDVIRSADADDAIPANNDNGSAHEFIEL